MDRETTNPLITSAFAAAMAAAGIKPKKPTRRDYTYLKAQRDSAKNPEERIRVAQEKRARKAAKLEAEAVRGGIRRAE